MGMKSPELLTLVESCPKGAETLVTRVIHILTDKGTLSQTEQPIINNTCTICSWIVKLIDDQYLSIKHLAKDNWNLFFLFMSILTASPSPELVERVRDLYHKRVPDVRFLIPVLTGLAKVSSHKQKQNVLIYASNYQH